MVAQEEILLLAVTYSLMSKPDTVEAAVPVLLLVPHPVEAAVQVCLGQVEMVQQA
jgi:hypothetical protein